MVGSNKRGIDGILISLEDTRWYYTNRKLTENQPKIVNLRLVMNVFNSREMLNINKAFLKGGMFTVLCKDARN